MPSKRKATASPPASESPPSTATRLSESNAAEQNPQDNSRENEAEHGAIAEPQAQTMNAGIVHGVAGESCQLISPKIKFSSPWNEKGHIEVMSGTDGLGSGSIRLCKGAHGTATFPNVMLVPFKHIEQVIVMSKSKAMFQVIIVPTAATGASALLRSEPQIIQFDWPDRKANRQLKGVVGEKANAKNDTYLSVLKSVLDEQLAVFDKEVIVYTAEDEEDDSTVFRFEAHLDPIRLSRIRSKQKGDLFFFPSGILWLAPKILFLPIKALKKVLMIHVIDLATDPTGPTPYIAVDFLAHIGEPFYEARQEMSETSLLRFRELYDDASIRVCIYDYLETHEVEFQKVEQTFYNYERNQPMSSYGPLGALRAFLHS